MRILVVEDERHLSRVMDRGLTKAGFVVDVAHDGVTGQWLAVENPYDVVVLDIMLPARNGYDVLRNMRNAQVWTPVLMLTAKDGEYDQTDAFDLGADDYLTKPFSFPVLIAHLHALIRRGAPKRPVVLRVGELTLDPSRRTVSRAGIGIQLTAKEFALLTYFMRNEDHVLSRAQILDNVWDPAFDGNDNIVEVYVSYLRRKIDDTFEQPMIETVRGMGYRIVSSPPTHVSSRGGAP